MPAPDRTLPKQRFTTSIEFPFGIWGHYNDREIDALLAALPSGGAAVDLSPYATTVEVDGKLATIYTKPEVDAAIAAAVAAAVTGGTVDLSAYATAAELDAVKTEILTAATVAFVERYTKREVDGLFVQKVDMVAPPTLDGYATEQYVDDSIARIPATDLSGIASDVANLQGIVGTYQSATDNSLSLLNQGFATVAQRDDVDAALAAKADQETTYTKAETAAAIAAAATGTVDLSAYAKTTDADQVITTKSVIAQGYGFSTVEVLKVHDTGEGYGPRLSWITAEGGGVNIDMVCLKSDIDPLAAMLPRVEALESKAAPAEVDLSEYAKLTDSTQTIVASAVEASRFRFDATRSVILLQSNGAERPVYRDGAKNNALAYVSDLAAYCTIMDAATQIAACAKKAETYTKVDCDTKFLTLVDVNGVYANAAETYTKPETDGLLKKYVSVAFLTGTVLPTYFTKTEADGRYALKGETAAQTLQGVSVNDPALAEFRTSVMAEVRAMMAGGKTVPADLEWTPCTKVAGSGLIEARVLNGMIQLRGDLVLTVTSFGSFTLAQRLPANFPKPPQTQVVVAFGKEDGVAFRRVFVEFSTSGGISICGDGKTTHTTLTGAQAYAY